MNKKLIYGMIALLITSLFFLGCPTDASDDSSGIPAASNAPRQNPAQAAQNTASALATAGIPAANISVNGPTITINNSGGSPVTLTGPLDVLPGVIVEIKGTVNTGTNTITVASGAEIKANGSAGGELKIESGGSVEVAPGGKLSIEGSGALDLESGGVLAITGVYELGTGNVGQSDGTVEVYPGGVLKAAAGNTVTPTTNARTIIHAGGVAYLEGDPKPFVGTDGDAKIELKEGTLTYGLSATGVVYELAGRATVNDFDRATEFTFYGGGSDPRETIMTLTTANSVLTIAEGANLTLRDFGSIAEHPLKSTVAGARLEIKGYIGMWSGHGVTNTGFYDLSNAQISPNNTVAGNYVWSTSIGGSNTGWLQQP
jgi:hypothetical protein